MSVIYTPKGRALEYAKLAANLYRGCENRCEYCFVPSVTRKSAEQFHSPDFIGPRKDILKQLEKDAKKYQGCPDNVLMSFTTDPYQSIEENLKITREAIKIFNKFNIGVTILTKSGMLAQRDFDLLVQNITPEFGVTLTCSSERQSRKWEPNAALPHERINNLKAAHEAGIKTYVSFEPVLCPEEVYRLISDTYYFVDFYKVGKLNYHPHAKTIDWPLFRENVIDILHAYDKDFMIKNDLLEVRL